MQSITERIVGTWRLVHSVSIDSNGNREYPYGEDAVGYIHYSDTGVMAVQISRKARNGTGDLSNFRREYMAYFGRYEIDETRQVVRHFIEGQIFPNQHPAIVERKYRFDGDFMYLVPQDGTNREILWQRVERASRLDETRAVA